MSDSEHHDHENDNENETKDLYDMIEKLQRKCDKYKKNLAEAQDLEKTVTLELLRQLEEARSARIELRDARTDAEMFEQLYEEEKEKVKEEHEETKRIENKYYNDLYNVTNNIGQHCTICHEKSETKCDMVKLSCMHSFHLVCFMNYMAKSDPSQHCPNCRQEYELPSLTEEILELRRKNQILAENNRLIREEREIDARTHRAEIRYVHRLLRNIRGTDITSGTTQRRISELERLLRSGIMPQSPPPPIPIRNRSVSDINQDIDDIETGLSAIERALHARTNAERILEEARREEANTVRQHPDYPAPGEPTEDTPDSIRIHRRRRRSRTQESLRDETLGRLATLSDPLPSPNPDREESVYYLNRSRNRSADGRNGTDGTVLAGRSRNVLYRPIGGHDPITVRHYDGIRNRTSNRIAGVSIVTPQESGSAVLGQIISRLTENLISDLNAGLQINDTEGGYLIRRSVTVTTRDIDLGPDGESLINLDNGTIDAELGIVIGDDHGYVTVETRLPPLPPLPSGADDDDLSEYDDPDHPNDGVLLDEHDRALDDEMAMAMDVDDSVDQLAEDIEELSLNNAENRGIYPNSDGSMDVD